MDLSENVVYPIVPIGFADHYPVFKWLFHWDYTQHFQTNPYTGNIVGTSHQPYDLGMSLGSKNGFPIKNILIIHRALRDVPQVSHNITIHLNWVKTSLARHQWIPGSVCPVADGFLYALVQAEVVRCVVVSRIVAP